MLSQHVNRYVELHRSIGFKFRTDTRAFHAPLPEGHDRVVIGMLVASDKTKRLRVVRRTLDRSA